MRHLIKKKIKNDILVLSSFIKKKKHGNKTKHVENKIGKK